VTDFAADIEALVRTAVLLSQATKAVGPQALLDMTDAMIGRVAVKTMTDRCEACPARGECGIMEKPDGKGPLLIDPEPMPTPSGLPEPREATLKAMLDGAVAEVRKLRAEIDKRDEERLMAQVAKPKKRLVVKKKAARRA
jgi:hypothetical protein